LVLAAALAGAGAALGQQPRGEDKSAQSQPPAKARANTRPAPPPPPAGVRAIRDLDYVGSGHPLQKLDLYVPEDTDGNGPLPLVVSIHGGGWFTGFKEHNRALYLTRKGFVVANIDYRLSSDGPFPIMIEDCRAAIRWLRANSWRYKIDRQRIGVWGDSAGGHLVALLGTAAEQTEWDDVGGNPGVPARVQAVCDWYGPADIPRFASAPHSALADKAIKGLLGGPAEDRPDLARKASPVTYASSDDPPFLIIHGDADDTVPLEQSRRLFDKLQQAGVDATLIVVKNGRHGGWGPNTQPTLAEIRDTVTAFFETHLKKGPAN
jgi:acetyl esterase/lipase